MLLLMLIILLLQRVVVVVAVVGVTGDDFAVVAVDVTWLLRLL